MGLRLGGRNDAGIIYVFRQRVNCNIAGQARNDRIDADSNRGVIAGQARNDRTDADSNGGDD